MLSSIPSLFLFFLCFADGTAVLAVPSSDPCPPKQCSPHGPLIQFPFWHDEQPRHCIYHRDFNLSCDKDRNTLLSLPHTQRQLIVKSIRYDNRSVLVQDPKGCLPLLLAKLNLSRFFYQSVQNDLYGSPNYTLFNCPPPERKSMTRVGCLSQPGYDVYAVKSDAYVGDWPLLSCERRSGSVDLLPMRIENMMDKVHLSWNEGDCRECTKPNRRCRWNGSITYCIGPPPGHKSIALNPSRGRMRLLVPKPFMFHGTLLDSLSFHLLRLSDC